MFKKTFPFSIDFYEKRTSFDPKLAIIVIICKTDKNLLHILMVCSIDIHFTKKSS